MTDESASPVTRRAVLVGAAGVTAFATLLVRRAEATPEMMKAAIHRLIGEQPVRKGKVALDIPRWSRTATRSPCRLPSTVR